MIVISQIFNPIEIKIIIIAAFFKFFLKFK